MAWGHDQFWAIIFFSHRSAKFLGHYFFSHIHVADRLPIYGQYIFFRVFAAVPPSKKHTSIFFRADTRPKPLKTPGQPAFSWPAYGQPSASSRPAGRLSASCLQLLASGLQATVSSLPASNLPTSQLPASGRRPAFWAIIFFSQWCPGFLGHYSFFAVVPWIYGQLFFFAAPHWIYGPLFFSVWS